MLPEDFARTGLHVWRRDGPPPARFQVLGERSSGTNLVKRLLARNSGLAASEALGWKHGFPQAIAIPADLAVICMTRNAADWALSMHRRPWHATPPMQALAFSDFIRAPWQSHIDRAQYFRAAPGGAIRGQPLQQDRDPVTGRAFANIFALRRAKLAGLLSYLGRACTVAILRLETVQADQQAATARLCAALGAGQDGAPVRPVTRRLGSRFVASVNPRPATPDRIAPPDMAFMRGQLDEACEARLGYVY
ncbi:MAG: hypothetical protein ACK5MY_10890 [Jhaorihella sp.]